MISQSDVQGRLRLFRYGLIVVVVVTFLVSILAPAVYLNGASAAGLETPPLSSFLGNAVILTIVVAVIAAIAYAGYHYFLTKTWPMMGGK